jgi:D-alanyl-D-alanine carboxypeptidase/D-alanyl-D-alanine-endopeptidase (penicillin-binding protein 4)
MNLLAAALFNASPAQLDDWFAANAGKPYEVRLYEAARFAVGTPYADGPLGEGPGGTHDTDPLIDLTRVDCVTYIEQSIALAASDNLESATALLQKIRYRGGVIGYEERHHFFVADWLAHNSWCADVTRTLGVPVKSLTRTISRKGFFEKVNASGLAASTPDRQVEVAYIPIESAIAGIPNLPPRAIITFVGKVDWLFALHCGLYLENGEGQGLLHHASSKSGKAVAMPLETYCEEQRSRYVGILVHEVGAPE